MKLTVLDRIMIANILPQEGDITTLFIIRKLKEELGFTEEESAILNFKQVEQRLSWDGNIEKDVEIGKKAKQIICEALEFLDENRKLTLDHVSIWTLFKKAPK